MLGFELLFIEICVRESQCSDNRGICSFPLGSETKVV